MNNMDPINERYERQKDKIDRLHIVLEDIYNETHYFEKLGARIVDTKTDAFAKIDGYMNSLDDDEPVVDRVAACSDIIEFSRNLLLELEGSYISLNNKDLQEYVDELFGCYIKCISEDVLIVGKNAERIKDLIGALKVKPFIVTPYWLPGAEDIDKELNGDWPCHYLNYAKNFGELYFFYVRKIINKIAATFKYHAIKEFMETYNATMFTMMSVQNRAAEQLIRALQEMERV